MNPKTILITIVAFGLCVALSAGCGLVKGVAGSAATAAGTAFGAELRVVAGGGKAPRAEILASRVAAFERAYRGGAVDPGRFSDELAAFRERAEEVAALGGGAFRQEPGVDEAARGMALDLAAEAARADGVEAFLLELGGTVYAAGAKSRGAPWRVVVGSGRLPEDGREGRGVCSFPLRNRALAAARAPKDSPQGAAAGIREVAVAAPSALAAEALAEAFLELGPAAWGRLAAGLPGFDAVFLTDDGFILATAGLYGALSLEAQGYEVLRL